MAQPDPQADPAKPLVPAPSGASSPSLDALPNAAGMAALAKALRLSFFLLILVMVGAILTFFLRSLFAVEQHEQGIVLRFGKLLTSAEGVSVLGPGSHFTWPHPIDEKIRVPSSRLQTVESKVFWFDPAVLARAAGETQNSLRPGLDGYSLTGDLNIVHSSWAVRYLVTDPLQYAFSFDSRGNDFSQVNAFLQLLLHQAVTHSAASLPIDDVWRNREDKFRLDVQSRLAERARALNLGIQIERVDLSQVAPPRQVKEAFDSVMQAETDRTRQVQDASAYATQVATQAVSEAVRQRSQASAYRGAIVQRTDADLSNFLKLLPEYQANPALFRAIRYEDTLRRVLAQVDDKIIITDAPGRELRLELGREAKSGGARAP